MTSPSPRNRLLLIFGLGLTQIIGYGTLYYSFSILAPDMAADFGWPVEVVFGIFSASLLAGGLIAPRVGRWMDQYGASRIMTIGSAAAAVILIICASAFNPVAYVAGIVAIEIVSALVLYNAAFATLVQIIPGNAQRSITHLTLIAGFASTIFWPVTVELHDHFSWRAIYLIFAALNLAVCLPVHFWITWLARQAARAESANQPAHTKAPGGTVIAEHRRRAFLLTATGFALQGFALASLLFHMVPLLGAVGLGASAVLVGTLFGPAQVLSRFTNMLMGRNISPLTLAILSAVFIIGGASVLIVSGDHLWGAILFALLVGLGSGLASIVQGSLPLFLFGASGYGEMLGKLAAVRLAVSAAAPFAFAVLIEQGGAWVALSSVVVLGIGAVVAFTAIGRWPRPEPAVAEPC
ncbi:arsenite efflux MFS transporter ArsK [Pararhizobium sp. DWP3-4]|uniref:arsenite efflux MFS transporter ArsK n=1 Tax=Pararhizobium sp. DWP3-4 TaxID=2804565 RepID=UPI003CEE535B